MNLTTFIAELEKLEKAATPGPWGPKHYDCNFKGDGHKSVGNEKHGDALFGARYYENLDFIAHSRNALPKLLACVKVLSEAVGFYSVGKLHLDYEKFQTGKGAPNHVVGKFARQALSKCESIIANKGVK